MTYIEYRGMKHLHLNDRLVAAWRTVCTDPDLWLTRLRAAGIPATRGRRVNVERTIDIFAAFVTTDQQLWQLQEHYEVSYFVAQSAVRRCLEQIAELQVRPT
jgi:hypothetical protein